MRWKDFLKLGLIILVLNLIWEFSQYRLYNDLTQIPSTLHLILASFADVFLILVIFMFVCLTNKKICWFFSPKEKDYFFVIIFGLILAFIWELINLRLGRWEYTYYMPLFFSVGLSPLLQLSITGSLGLLIKKFI
ncbi:MAG: hypothetical protein OQK82_00520 [Candidatus Pacearchaeota archaeon]|nr:hypothetical protein [Candidatus Pacearchaeota archaeon]